MRPSTCMLLGCLLLALPSTRAFAAGEADFTAAYAAAEQADSEAGTHKNQWTTTSAALAAAKKAASNGDYEKAVSLAKEAEALAKASIAQFLREREAWRESVIR